MRRVLLLRGVNVGGVRLAMADFVAALHDVGAREVVTLIQSGNAVFGATGDAQDLRTHIHKALAARTGLAPALFLYDLPEFEAILAECPFQAQAEAKGTSVHVNFLASPPGPGVAKALGDLARNGEEFCLTARALHLLMPAGIGRSDLAAAFPRLFGAGVTGRNWNTLRRLRDLARAGDP